ncbi:class I SAM-dependent methyltransferase [Actinoallomurus rhizosphaericola]|uniref:class I SAM-dependent methyltransferase n=1 Tax=Actinoallomurus rhizosphaericola TaxID=2952536 RepID=UPI002093660E|nr:class I SAM-dependent methyltransferase [Actinoallomurus rhizosphaericola]MCO5996686.1 methyltransferase domain-containing protein [Actinoallomurus rhizosphaericola]
MTDSAARTPRWTMPVPAPTDTAQTYWEGFYRGWQPPADWVARANPLFAREAAALPAGTALDLGCGTGGDAIWLAERGWRVTAVDVSETVLRRAAAAAAEAGVADRITWQQHDLSRSFPDGVFDLVSAQFLHSPVAGAGEWEAILASAAAAVGPGGTLLVIGHAGWPSWFDEPPMDFRLPANSDALDVVAAGPGEWTVDTDEVITRELTGPAGETGTRDDTVLRVHRLA